MAKSGATCDAVNDQNLKAHYWWCLHALLVDRWRCPFISIRVKLLIADLINTLFGVDTIVAGQ